MDRDPTDVEAQLVQRQRSSIPSFLFLMIMLFMLTNHNGDEFLARHQYQDAVRSLSWQLSNFTAWMNGTETNFTLPDRDPSVAPITDALLPEGVLLNPYHTSYYTNITGFVKGDAHYYNISPSAVPELNSTLQWKEAALALTAQMNMTAALETLGTWNWTTSEKVSLSVAERPPNPIANVTEKIAIVHGRIEFTDTITEDDLKLEFEAIHFISNGSIYGLVDPSARRNIDIRLLPSLVPEHVRNDTARALQPELSARIIKLQNLIDAGIVDGDSPLVDEAPKTSCHFELYGQIGASGIPEDLMQELENELQKPTGITTVKQPDLMLNIVLLSKECGILYEINNTEGVRSRIFDRRVTSYAGIAAFVYLVMLIVLMRQMERSRTPVGLSKASRWTFFCQSVVDAIAFAAHMTVAVVVQGRSSVSLIAPSFLAGIVFFYEAQFSVLIHHVQASEEPAPIPLPPPPPPRPALPLPPLSPPLTQRGAAPIPPPSPLVTFPIPPPSPPTVAAQSPADGTLPTQATAAPGQSTNTSLGWAFFQHVRADPSARLWFSLFLFLTFLVRVILSPVLSFIILGALYSSVWLPQIVRSARKGRSSGLSSEYIVVTTLCRLYFILYFLAWPKNVLDVEPRSWTLLLVLFVSALAGILLLQESLGPAFFLPKRFAVQTYNYHPPISTLVDAETPAQTLGDCAICMEDIHIEHHRDADGEEKRRKSGIFDAVVGTTGSKKSYSVAPCHHIFHTECLQRWLDLKNICPQCRRPLPPL